MLRQDDLDRLVDAMRANGVTTLEIDDGGDVLRLSLSPTPAAFALAPSAASAVRVAPATSPCIGHFRPRGEDDGLPALAAGATVRAQEILGYVCAGAARGLVSAPADGVLIGEPPAAGTLVGYGDVIVEVEVA